MLADHPALLTVLTPILAAALAFALGLHLGHYRGYAKGDQRARAHSVILADVQARSSWAQGYAHGRLDGIKAMENGVNALIVAADSDNVEMTDEALDNLGSIIFGSADGDHVFMTDDEERTPALDPILGFDLFTVNKYMTDDNNDILTTRQEKDNG